MFLAVFGNCCCLWLLPPISSNCFHQFPLIFSPNAQIFRPESLFFVLSARQTCLPGRHVCLVDMSARQTSLLGRHFCKADMSSGRKCLPSGDACRADMCAGQICLCLTEMSLPDRDVCTGKRHPKNEMPAQDQKTRE